MDRLWPIFSSGKMDKNACCCSLYTVSDCDASCSDSCYLYSVNNTNQCIVNLVCLGLLLGDSETSSVDERY